MNRPDLATLVCAIGFVLCGCSTTPDTAALSVQELLTSADLAYSRRPWESPARAHLYLDELLRRNPRDAEALWRRARVLAFAGRFEEAYLAASSASEAAPGLGMAWVWTGYAGAEAVAARKSGLRLPDASRVVAALERGLELAPDDARVHLGFGLIALALEGEEAPGAASLPDPAVHLETARELRPGLPRTHLILGRFHLDRGEVELARVSLLRLDRPPPEAEESSFFPDAQIAEWIAARAQATGMLEVLAPR